MKTTRVVHGAALEVACYHEGDFLLRVSHADQPLDRVNDGFVPRGDVGFLWVREVGGSWIVSGMVAKSNFPAAHDVEAFVEWALGYFANICEAVHARVELVEVVDEWRASMEE